MATLAAPLIEKVPGANLRQLMRNRLKKSPASTRSRSATGAKRTGQQRAGLRPWHDYDAMASYTPTTATAAPATTPRSSRSRPGTEQGQEAVGRQTLGQERQAWQRDGQRGATACRRRSNHLAAALRTLLHHPQLAGKVEDAGHFADEEHLYSQLLVALIEAAQKNPKLSSMQLIARWHGTEQGRLLRALAEKEWLIDADNLEQQFFDTITSLSARQRERSLEQLLRKSRQRN
jgi:DNA primase